ncbi:MAG: sulfite reductase (NADPH) hemoprotein beta-component [Rhodospirillaceae bacterium]|nr:MAG: sulfite reductase (NADPH) hemoprotein beta-component [Rhodospirillaceae bacterium]
MYRYDVHDRALVAGRVDEFRGQVRRRLQGELNEDQFRPLRLMNGVYLQLHSYMLRVAIPYGVLASHQLRLLATIAHRYDRGLGHFTTRQNLQFNWIGLEDVPDVLGHLARVDMHAIQTSGNCIRNITTDPFAGVAKDEVEDPRITAELLRQWSTFHPEFLYLPRKFKVAVTGAREDRAAVRWHDIGLRLVRDAAGTIGYEVIAGGGQGRTPVIGATLRSFLPKADLLPYIEAIMRLYNRFGRRDNKYKARIKILLQDVGIEAFARMVEEEWPRVRRPDPHLIAAETARLVEDFALPYRPRKDSPVDTTERDLAFWRWVAANVAPHQSADRAIVTLPLKSIDQGPGDITAEKMETVADLADRYSHAEMRISHHQNIVLPHVRWTELPRLWETLERLGLAEPIAGLAPDIVACPGMDYCALATARSIGIAQDISKRLAALAPPEHIGALRLNISGCINACGHHHAGHIGILGVDKRGEEFYQITIGGSDDYDATLGTLIGPAVPAARVADAIESLVLAYLAHRQGTERFLETYRRLGITPFKEAFHAVDQE